MPTSSRVPTPAVALSMPCGGCLVAMHVGVIVCGSSCGVAGAGLVLGWCLVGRYSTILRVLSMVK